MPRHLREVHKRSLPDTPARGSTGKRKLAEGKQDLGKSWREALGPPPKRSNGLKEWIKFQKKKWQFQAAQRKAGECGKRSRVGVSRQAPITLGGFLRQTKRTLLDTPWQVIKVAETPSPGFYKVKSDASSELENQQRFQVEKNVSKMKRESEGWGVAAGLVSEMLNSVTEAEDVAKQLLEELLDRVCRKKDTVYKHLAEAVLGEMKEAELGIMEIQGE